MKKKTAFTLTEIMIVISIIVLLIAIAIPAFNLISGGRSIEGATNQVSALLGRARAQAIGVQKKTGVMFYIDAVSQRRMLAIVTETDAPPASGAVDVWLDVDETAEALPLPKNISA